MFVAEVLAALIGVHYGWRWVLTECVQERSVGQLGAMVEAELPAEYLPRLETYHQRQVVPLSLKPDVRKVLYPTTRLGHPGVIHAILWPGFIPKHGVLLQAVCRGWYLWR